MNWPSSGSDRPSSTADSLAARPGQTLRRHLARYAETARALGAANVTFLGTEPIRRAADAGSIVRDAAEAAGAPLHVLSHEEEAYLTIIGVTEGMPVTHETLVVDVGGGSSEFCIVDAVHRPRAAGLQVGSARLTDRFATDDPPTPHEVAAMRAAAADVLRAAPDVSPTELIAVGGTASNLVKMLPESIADRMLTRERIAAIQSILATQPAAATAVRFAHQSRSGRGSCRPVARSSTPCWNATARTPSGSPRPACAKGVILAVDHGGPSWRDRLPDLAHGWRT